MIKCGPSRLSIMAELYRIILPVRDLEEAVGFFQAVLGSLGERISPGRHYFTCGGTILACYDPKLDGDDPEPVWRPHFNQYLYFAVDDLEATRKTALAAGAQEVTEIEDMPWGERMLYLRDPSGNPLSFVQAGTEFKGG
jgi:uncharacterized glyoxalase superfamily protein PhnB